WQQKSKNICTSTKSPVHPYFCASRRKRRRNSARAMNSASFIVAPYALRWCEHEPALGHVEVGERARCAVAVLYRAESRHAAIVFAKARFEHERDINQVLPRGLAGKVAFLVDVVDDDDGHGLSQRVLSNRIQDLIRRLHTGRPGACERGQRIDHDNAGVVALE